MIKIDFFSSALSSFPLSLDILHEIINKFDNSNLPFIVHVSDFSKLNPSFFKLIQSTMVKL